MREDLDKLLEDVSNTSEETDIYSNNMVNKTHAIEFYDEIKPYIDEYLKELKELKDAEEIIRAKKKELDIYYKESGVPVHLLKQAISTKRAYNSLSEQDKYMIDIINDDEDIDYLTQV